MNPIVSPNPNHPRYVTKTLPPYSYIPGLNPHPVRDPQGHSYGQTHVPLTFIAPEKWCDNADYLFGVDLYNYAYWWESHEAWENVWHTTDKDSPYGQFLQGLIQISTAFIKWYSHEDIGMRKLYDLGMMRLKSVEKSATCFMGLDLSSHIAKLERHFAVVLKMPQTWPDPLLNYPNIVLSSPTI